MNEITTPLFWCLKVADQAKLMRYNWDNFGTHLSIPTPPRTSVAAWKITIEENTDEIERLMKLPSHSHLLEKE